MHDLPHLEDATFGDRLDASGNHTWWLVVGLLAFGFYYMANAMERLIGTISVRLGLLGTRPGSRLGILGRPGTDQGLYGVSEMEDEQARVYRVVGQFFFTSTERFGDYSDFKGRSKSRWATENMTARHLVSELLFPYIEVIR
ncbi:hypothetical protein [Chromohalobacter japonicus]|uniref:hypothetical protein n=1 Tax=Chromohalobacter japonicus TaxID=223900 RepID=UPI001FF47603|nr:hypothetical protein [Chromohalobacter japonicus]MCK0753663.1 hypothetical protein [Chromohalobacter japonicus]